jgi:signal transduction histidine kinase
MPLQVKLPLLMSALLAVLVVVTTIATHATLREYAVSRVEERLVRAARQITTLSATGIVTGRARYMPIINDAAVRRALAEGRMNAAAQAVLERAPLPADSGVPVELFTADGRRIGLVGRDVRAVLSTGDRPEVPEPIASTQRQSVGGADSLIVTPLYHDGGRTYLWFVVPIREGRRVVGYLTHQRRISASGQTNRTLRELSGDSVSLHWRNADASYWATATGEPMSTFTDVDSAAITARAPDGTQVLFHEERIAGTPVIIGLSVPIRSVLAGPQRAVRRLLMFGLGALVVGSLIAWLIGRSVARPVADVARAAEELGRGNYAVRVPETGEVEARRLAASFNTMASEIGAARAALERQTREAQSANSAKSEFLTTMSHELRTPLNAIGGYVDLIEMGLRGPITDDQRRDLERIKASQQHLLGLISSVLDLSRIEAGQLSYERVSIAVEPFLANIDVLVAPQAAAKTLTLRKEIRVPELAVLADREKLRQIMINLLSNAVRHTPPGGTITMTAVPRGNQIAIEVEDTGPGIPADRRASVFEPFVQLDRSLSQTREGLGLGLAISRDLARGMDGDLIAEEANGGGARFVLTLPIAEYDSAVPVTHTAETKVVRR